MNQSTNYNFNLPEGSDLVNLLTQLIPNWEDLDTILKNVENQALTNCTEVVSLGVHAISRSNADGKILKWIATANFTAGDTFTVDGSVVAASTPSGGTLGTNAYVSGAVIIAALNSDESALTIYVTGSNVAADSEKLGGQLPSYYAKQSDMNTAQLAITDLDNLAGTTSISGIGDGTLTGAVSEINNDVKANTRGTIVTITTTNDYTATNDGYVRTSGSGAECTIKDKDGTNLFNLQGSAALIQNCFIRKGMIIHATTIPAGTSIWYIPLVN